MARRNGSNSVHRRRSPLQPRQPIHFAHGYDWIALFLLGTPALIGLLEKLLAIRRPSWRALAVAGFLAVFLSDNLLWFASFADRSVQDNTIPITRDDRDVLRWLEAHAAPPAYVVSSNKWINYLTPTYTHVRSWSGHEANTPDARRRFTEQKRLSPKASPSRPTTRSTMSPRATSLGRRPPDRGRCIRTEPTRCGIAGYVRRDSEV